MSFVITINKDNRWGFDVGRVFSRLEQWVEVQWYNTYYKGRSPAYCHYRPVFVEAGAGKEVFTSQPLTTDKPFFAEVCWSNVLMDRVELTKDGCIPLKTLKDIQLMVSKKWHLPGPQDTKDDKTIQQVVGPKIMTLHRDVTPQLVGTLGGSVYKLAHRDKPRKQKGRNIYSACEITKMLDMLSEVSGCMQSNLSEKEKEAVEILSGTLSHTSSVEY